MFFFFSSFAHAVFFCLEEFPLVLCPIAVYFQVSVSSVNLFSEILPQGCPSLSLADLSASFSRLS